MLYERVAHEILSVEEVKTAKQTAIVRRGVALYANLRLSADGANVSVALREPVIPETEWQGALIAEDLAVSVFVDDEPAGGLALVAGRGEFSFAAAVPGAYRIRVEAPLCRSAEVEVAVSG